MKFTSIFFPASESIFDLSKVQKKEALSAECLSLESFVKSYFLEDVSQRCLPGFVLCSNQTTCILQFKTITHRNLVSHSDL